MARRQADHDRHRGAVRPARHEAVLGRQLRVAGEIPQPLAGVLKRRDAEAEHGVAEQELQPVGIERACGEQKGVRESAGAERREVGLELEEG